VNWGSWDNFWAMGGYGFYVWGAYAVTAAGIAIEIWRLRLRRARAVAELQREATRARSAS
jgi:heme exporter protein D